MDSREQEIKRQALQGDISAAIRLERIRNQSGLTRSRNRDFPSYAVEINQRYIQGPIIVTPWSNKRFTIRSAAENPLWVNNIPYELRFTFYHFTEEDDLRVSLYPSDAENFIIGWYPAEPETIISSQEAERRSGWSLSHFLLDHYDSGGPHHTMYRAQEGMPRWNPPTPKARKRLTEFLTEFIAIWAENHPQEVDHAHAIFLNNQIIEQKVEYDRLLLKLEQRQRLLGGLIIEELRYH